MGVQFRCRMASNHHDLHLLFILSGGKRIARSRLIRISALNITIDNHSPIRYVELFRDAFRRKERVQYRGDRYGMIGTMKPLDPASPEKGLSGFIHRFLEIPSDEPWLNIDLGEKAEEKDMKAVSIPEKSKAFPKRIALRVLPQTSQNDF